MANISKKKAHEKEEKHEHVVSCVPYKTHLILLFYYRPCFFCDCYFATKIVKTGLGFFPSLSALGCLMVSLIFGNDIWENVGAHLFLESCKIFFIKILLSA